MLLVTYQTTYYHNPEYYNLNLCSEKLKYNSRYELVFICLLVHVCIGVYVK
jgi:hypothetical protein